LPPEVTGDPARANYYKAFVTIAPCSFFSSNIEVSDNMPPPILGEGMFAGGYDQDIEADPGILVGTQRKLHITNTILDPEDPLRSVKIYPVVDYDSCFLIRVNIRPDMSFQGVRINYRKTAI